MQPIGVLETIEVFSIFLSAMGPVDLVTAGPRDEIPPEVYEVSRRPALRWREIKIDHRGLCPTTRIILYMKQSGSVSEDTLHVSAEPTVRFPTEKTRTKP